MPIALKSNKSSNCQKAFLCLILLTFTESMTCLDLETKNLTTYTTDKPLGGSWTDKVLGLKDKESDVCNKKEEADEGDGVAEEEWVGPTFLFVQIVYFYAIEIHMLGFSAFIFGGKVKPIADMPL